MFANPKRIYKHAMYAIFNVSIVTSFTYNIETYNIVSEQDDLNRMLLQYDMHYRMMSQNAKLTSS